MSGTKQYVARTSPRLVELGKPNLNVAEECVILPARGKTLSGLPSVPEDASASQPDLPGHYASLDPSEGAEDTPTGTPNPSGGGGPGGGDGGDGDGGGPPGGGPPPPGGGPPGGGPDPNPNPGPNPNPDGDDGGGPPDDDDDHSSDDAEDKALNRSYKDDLAIIAKHVVDKDGGNIKVRVPDTFNGSDLDKLRDFILGCRLYFRGNK
ncbi:hypothetical protein M422DRAFT_274768 [Sphaerobolus stellatus SS14]|uniref:Uncharacterized protein n=1 Tax=Sphaerobolus stellatus (strain SS14) TaxID=990650 RepID=A0A0C9T6B6_SPHS4|nr:hypothetical protein M422DRAFT_274768 [Sphaerobolus stellatus SS14]